MTSEDGPMSEAEPARDTEQIELPAMRDLVNQYVLRGVRRQ